MTSAPDDPSISTLLDGQRVAFLGRMASMSQREAAILVRRHGAMVAERPGATTNLVVLGEDGLAMGEGSDVDELFDGPTLEAIEQGTLEVITETQLWQRLGMVDAEQDIHQLYTPAMLAELLNVSVAIIRRWHRRGLIVPVREVQRLPYFDFHEVVTARRLVQLLSAGMSPDAVERKLATLARYVPDVDRPLAQLGVIIEGKEILMRQGDGLVEPGGQRRFDFDASPPPEPPLPTEAELEQDEQALLEADPVDPVPASAVELRHLAESLEESGQLDAATEALRAALAAGGPDAEICFQLGELLYCQDDLAGARERYFMAIELDENYVEARVNLGCILAETGQTDLAVAAFQGALSLHPDYADAHYHLARNLDVLGDCDEAEGHWRAFCELAPESPWAEQAQHRLASGDSE